MGWYRQGTVNVTNGSAAVVGVLTGFTSQVKAGDALIGPDGRWYEVATTPATDTALTLVTPYIGATAAGAAYTIVRLAPAWGQVSSMAEGVAALLSLLVSPSGAEAGLPLRVKTGGGGFLPGGMAMADIAGLATALAGKLGVGAVRERLTGNRTYYVRLDGSDTNNGLADAAGNAFRTIQKAVDTVAALDLAGWFVTIQLGNGTYGEAVTLKDPLGVVTEGQCRIRGNAASAGAVVVDAGTVTCFVGRNSLCGWAIEHMRLNGNIGIGCIGTKIDLGAGIIFGANPAYHVYASARSTVRFLNNYTIVGGAFAHQYAVGQSSVLTAGLTVTLTGTPAFTYYNYAESQSSIRCNGNTYVGTATGARFFANVQSTIEAYAALTYLPGNAAGIQTNGGLYI